MSENTIDTEYTKTSSKGQIVIPAKIRRDLNINDGSLFAVTARDDTIILKKISSNISPEDMKTLKLVKEAWKNLDKGSYKVRSRDDFFKELEEW
ncbi:MAG: AbrB/MazE/SpoVT family DNA-binding domain-containing protein [Thermoplasmataceae archaeon]|jgi:AbrB family looped-hinge helix DNA binding protein